MLYKFKSQATSDLIMLEPHGRRVLTIVGKDPARAGIIEPSQMSAAIEALHAAAEHEAAEQKAAVEQAQAQGEPVPVFEAVSLRHRVSPMVEMLKRSAMEKAAVTWGT
jgi:hypothetical protein